MAVNSIKILFPVYKALYGQAEGEEEPSVLKLFSSGTVFESWPLGQTPSISTVSIFFYHCSVCVLLTLFQKIKFKR